MNPILIVVLLIGWLYILRVFRRAELSFWHFIWGSFGLFIAMMVLMRPVLTQPLAQVVAAIAGIFGKLTGMFTAYFKYGVIFVNSSAGSISMVIDFECSGILEIMAYVSLLAFFDAYTRFEKIVVGIAGVFYIILANALRITVISVVIHFFGVSAYYVAHTFIGRFVFYTLSVILYFYVFTKTQIIRQKVGGFTYGHSK